MKNAGMPIIPTWKSAGDMSKSEGGLTKREYMAAMAMQGLCTRKGYGSPAMVALDAVEFAARPTGRAG